MHTRTAYNLFAFSLAILLGVALLLPARGSAQGTPTSQVRPVGGAPVVTAGATGAGSASVARGARTTLGTTGVAGAASSDNATEVSFWDDPIGYVGNTVSASLKATFGTMLTFFTFGVTYILSSFVAALIELMGQVLEWGVALNRNVTLNTAVQLGWQTFRDVANLGFVIGILFIAFATMLRSERYGAKRMLGIFIIVALLVNYSLLIPGVILDASHVFAEFFIQKATGDAGGLSAALFSIMNQHQLTRVDGIDSSALAGIAQGINPNILSVILRLLMILFFSVIALIALGATAFMVFLRFFMVLFLLIVAPLAWLSIIFPALAGQWTRWWNTFMRWTLFFPSSMFFIFLAIKVVRDKNITSAVSRVSSSSEFAALFNTVDFKVVSQMVIATGLLIGGLIVSEKFGITGAATAIGMVKGMKDRALGAMKGAAKGAAVGAAGYTLTRPTKAVARGLANVINTGFRWVPGAKEATAKLSAFGTRKEEVAKYQKDYLGSLTDAQMESVYRTSPLGPVAKAALLAEAVKRGKVHLLTSHIADPAEKARRLKEFVDAAQATNPGTALEQIGDIKSIIAVTPDLAPDLVPPSKPGLPRDEHIAEVVAKIRADKAADIVPPSLEKEAVALALSSSQIGNIYRNGSEKQISALEGSVSKSLESTPAGKSLKTVYAQISAVEEKVARARRIGDKAEEKRLREDELKPLLAHEENLLANATGKEQKAYAQWKLLKEQVGGTFAPRKPLAPTPRPTPIPPPEEEEGEEGGPTPPVPPPPPPPPVPPVKPTVEERAEAAKQRGDREAQRIAQERAELQRRAQQDIAAGKEIVIGGSGEYTHISDAITELKRRGLADEGGRVTYPKVRVFVKSARGLEEQFLEGTEATRGPAPAPTPAPKKVPPAAELSEEEAARELRVPVEEYRRIQREYGAQRAKDRAEAERKAAEERLGAEKKITAEREKQAKAETEAAAKKVEGTERVAAVAEKERREEAEVEEKKVETAKTVATVAEKERAAEAERLAAEISKRAEARAESARLERERVEKGIGAAEAAGAARAEAEKTITAEQRRQAEIAEKQRAAEEELGRALTRKRPGVKQAAEELKKSIVPPAPRIVIKRPKTEEPLRPTQGITGGAAPTPPVEEKPRGAPGAGPDIEQAGGAGLEEQNR